MKFNYKILLKDTGFYGILLSINRLPDIILLSLFTQYLSKEEFAIYGLLVIIKVIITSIIGLGLDAALPRFIVDEKYKNKTKSLLTNIFSVILLCAVVILPICIIFKRHIFSLYNLSDKYIIFFNFLVFWALLSCINNFIQIWFRWTNKKINLLLVAGLNVFFYVLLSYLFLYFYDFGLIGAFYAAITTESLVLFLGLIFLFKKINSRLFNFKLIKELLSFSLPFMIVLVIGTLLPSIDRLFLTHYISKNALGTYVFAYRIAILYNLVLYALQFGFQPIIYKSIKGIENNLLSLKNYQTIYIIIISTAALFFVAISKIIIAIFSTEDYVMASVYLPYLVFASLIYSLQLFASLGVFYAKKSFLTLASILSGLLVCILINFFLTPLLLEKGAYLSLIFGNIVVVFLLYIMSKKYINLTLNYKVDLPLLLISFISLILFSYSWINTNIWYDAIIKCMAICCVITLCFYLWKFFFKTSKI